MLSYTRLERNPKEEPVNRHRRPGPDPVLLVLYVIALFAFLALAWWGLPMWVEAGRPMP